MKVSVVVAVLNSEKTIATCLDSIISQPLDTEIIVIDGGSTDETLAIIESYQHRISYLESGKDSGVADAFNRGINRATGEIVSILNSDDYWEENILPGVVDVFREQSHVDIVHGQCRFIVDDGEVYIKKPHMAAMKRYMSAYHCTMFVRASLYDRIGHYDSDYHLAMDSEWVHRAMEAGAIFYGIPLVLTNMRMGGLSDRLYVRALAEYRRSVTMHGIAGNVYAGFFFYLHVMAKVLSQVPLFRKLKTAYDAKFNKTVGSA